MYDEPVIRLPENEGKYESMNQNIKTRYESVSTSVSYVCMYNERTDK